MRTVNALRRMQMPSQDSEFFAFGGGLDIVTPPLFMKSGMARESQNYECDVNGGYARIKGYERFDGQAKPSDATYAIIGITLTGTIAVGNTITGGTSAATAVVIAAPDSTSRVLTKVVGVFQVGEDLKVAAVTQATATTTAVTGSAATPLLSAQYTNLAADVYRADILAVPGSGDVLGVQRFGGVTYAWRNNAGGTAAAIYASSAAGWVAVPLYNELSFTAGAVAIPAEGATITQGANTATLKRVVLISGTFAGGTAAGRFICTTPAPGNFVAGAATLTGGVTCTLSGVQTAITLLPGGLYEIVVENFGGSIATLRMYGCDGVNRGFEFDGVVLVPISTGMTIDTPNHVFAHLKQLFFSFLASVQHAAPGTPYVWSAVLGAAEIAMGDTVSGFMSQPGAQTSGALAIFSRNRTDILYGTGVSNWQKITYRSELGAYARSIQDMGSAVFLDDQGVMDMRTAQEFGNFLTSALSAQIRPWLNSERTRISASCIVRDKSQYRLFFSDNYALFVTFKGGRVVGMMQQLFSHPVRCVSSVEEPGGHESIFFGSSSGMVYQMENGTSFDGEDIEHYLSMAFNFSRSPRVDKSYQHCALEVTGTGYAAFNFSYQLGYNSTLIEQPGNQALETSFSPVFWDSFTWDAFVWDGVSLAPSVADMVGTAENFSLMLRGKSDFHQSVRFSGALVHFLKRRPIR
jgi:hypothetical protein